MAKDNKRSLAPKLRFPKFRDAPEWNLRSLGSACHMQAGKFVSPSEITDVWREDLFPCYGGNGLRGYTTTYTHTGEYPLIGRQGALCGNVSLCTGQFHATEHALVVTPESDVDVDWLFFALGLLNLNQYAVGQAQPGLSVQVLDRVSVAVPIDEGEQRKIADCLTSLEELIAAQGRRVEALKAHKKGLMQQLFPRKGETLPRRRFPEFCDASEWEQRKISSSIELISGVHLSPGQYSTEGELPYFTGPSDFTHDVKSVVKWTGRSTNTATADDTLITVKGSGVGEIWYLAIPCVAMGRQLMAVRAKQCSSRFVYYFLLTKRSRFEDLASGNLIPGLARGDILDMETPFPSQSEQQRIADCLSTLDAWIAAEADKLAALKTHKKGLMQQLFPSREGGKR
jgi:type I restriction enzyme S subunit